MSLRERVQDWQELGELDELYAEFEAYALGITVPSEVSTTLQLTSEQIRSAFDNLFEVSTFCLADSEHTYPTVLEAVEKFRSRIGSEKLLELLLRDAQSKGLSESELASELKRIAGNTLWKRKAGKR